MVQSNIWELNNFEVCALLPHLIETGELHRKVLKNKVIKDRQIVVRTGCKYHLGIIFLGIKAKNLIAWVENDIREAGFGFLTLRLSLCLAINNVADRQF